MQPLAQFTCFIDDPFQVLIKWAQAPMEQWKRYSDCTVPERAREHIKRATPFFQVEVNGLVCAGKILLDVGNVGVRDIAAKYVQECQLMSDLRHPNITLFLGLCFFPNCQLPVLVMERLDGSLDDLLETIPNIPLTLKRSMLEDVARGLLYLHKHDPHIIHRDLTAKNVLLTSSLVAKITDFGNSRIVNIQPGQLAQTLSRNPGTQVYMPPEALTVAA